MVTCIFQVHTESLVFLFIAEKNRFLSRCGFCRFMIKQIEQISSGEKVKSCDQGHSSSCPSLQDQIHDTFVLRLVSCVQLASKLSLHYNVSQ